MRFLIVLKQKRTLDTFAETLRALLKRGHEVCLAVQDGRAGGDRRIADELASPRLSIVTAPASRGDDWAQVAPLVRALRDYARYLGPEFRAAGVLRARALHKLQDLLGVRGDGTTVAQALGDLTAPHVHRLDAVMALAEAALPTDPLIDSFISVHAPDALLLSPVVHFGDAQTDYTKSARRSGVPVGMLLFSWDNLSTKGCLHSHPDWMFVWNERQKREATELHGFPGERIVVAGAPRFDEFFERRPVIARTEFLSPLGLDPAAPTLLYVCSSKIIAESELPVVRRWIAAIRSSSPLARTANLIVRPHPDVPLLPPSAQTHPLEWRALAGAKAFVARPFDDPRAVVLRTSYDTHAQQGFFECIFHSAAVVGLNTTAEIEAGIVGRPVLTFDAGSTEVSGQTGSLHFHYLLEAEGGFVKAAGSLTEHVQQVAAILEHPPEPARIRSVIEAFVRPHGLDRPVSPYLAEAIEGTFAAHHRQVAPETSNVVQPVATTGWAARPVQSGAAIDDGPRPPVRLDYAGASLWVHPTPETTKQMRRGVYRLERMIVDWLEARLAPGDVFYDIGAGIGAYTLVAAKRGARVVSFEPAFATFGRLCSNLLINACDGVVVPLSVALSDEEMLGGLRYAPGRVGQSGRYWTSKKVWGGSLPSREGEYIQPTGLVRLDTIGRLYDLPQPTHVRVGMASECERILRGAQRTLAEPQVRTLLLAHDGPLSEQAAALVADAGFREERVETLIDKMQCTVLARP